MNSFSCSVETSVYVLSISDRRTSMSMGALMLMVRLVAEDGGIRADPLPQGGGAHEACVGREAVLAQLARAEADRACEELTPALGELLEQPRQRRAALARHALGVPGHGEAHRLLRQPDADLLPCVQPRGRHEERDRDTLAVLEPGREVDQ